MKILIIHCLYQVPGGEDVVARQECALLKSRGHDARLMLRTNNSIAGAGKLRGLVSVLSGIWWPPSVAKALAEIESFGPDVVHIHNLWYQFNPSLVKGIKSLGIPVVMTLHNFRLVCANAVLLRNDAPCRKCVGGTGFWGVFHKCYRNSYFLSLCAFLMARLAGVLGVWRMDVDRFICLTGFSKGIFADAGFPLRKLVVKGNFLANEERIETDIAKTPEPSAVYLGRFTVDKGVPFLIRAWRNRKEKLYVAGTGDLPELPGNAEALGQLPRAEAMDLIRRSWVLVVPAIAYETFGLVILEAFRAGTPVLATSNGTFDTLIDSGRNGLLFRPGDEPDFHSKMDLLFRDEALRKSLAAEGKKTFDETHSESTAYAKLKAVYAEAAKSGRPHDRRGPEEE